MLLSRFWYLILSFALAAAAGILYIAHSYYNRHTERWMNEALNADATAVGWYLKDDARNRAAALLPVALSPDVREPLAKASEANEVPKDVRDKAKQGLAKAAAVARISGGTSRVTAVTTGPSHVRPRAVGNRKISDEVTSDSVENASK